MNVEDKGRIVFEQYPGMREADAHVLASAAKVTASLLVDVFIEEGKIDEQKTLGDYVPEFRGSVWEQIKVIDVMDMSTGLDTVDGPAHFVNPDSVIARMLRAEIGEPYKGNVETMLEVMKEAKPTSEPGEYFTYSSTATQALALLAEAVSGQTWAEAFDRRIWSKMGVEGPFQVHLTPDGIAMAHGLLSMRLRDLARFGMLYTPSWHKIAAEQIVTPEILEQTRTIIENRVNATGVAEPIVVTQGEDRISVELPGVDDEADIRSLIGTTGVLEFTPVPLACASQVIQNAPEPECLDEVDPLFNGTEISAALLAIGIIAWRVRRRRRGRAAEASWFSRVLDPRAVIATIEDGWLTIAAPAARDSPRPKRMLSAMVSSNSHVSWVTYPIWRRRSRTAPMQNWSSIRPWQHRF